MTDTPSLVAFLRARLDEDERDAQRVASAYADEESFWAPAVVINAGALVIPARVLAEVVAKRWIVEEHFNINDGDCSTCVVGQWGYPTNGGAVPQHFPCLTLRLLASVYADHPDYQEDWKP